MIAVVQRVTAGRVEVDATVVGEIDRGLVVLAAICRDDGDADLTWMAGKIAGLRVFPSDKGGFDLDVRAIGGGVLLVSNFTVAADTANGRRPSFAPAMSPDAARPMFDRLVEAVRAQGVTVATGTFGADMKVSLVNDGPITLLLNSRER